MRKHLQSRRRLCLPQPRRLGRNMDEGRRRRLLFRWRLLAALCLLALLMAVLDAKLRPLIKNYAVNHAQTITTRAVNEAVTRVLSGENVVYEDLVQLVRDDEGKIISVESDILKINRLKADVTNAVLDELENRKIQEVRIPLGTVIGGDLFNGRGPWIPIKISMSGTALTTLRSEFTSAGINQTNHQILMDVDMLLFMAIPGYNSSVEVKTQFMVAETVLVGKVPYAYMQMGEEAGILGKLFGKSG